MAKSDRRARSRLQNSRLSLQRYGVSGKGLAAELVGRITGLVWQALKILVKIILRWLHGYWRYLQVLTISVFFYVVVFLIMTRVQPAAIANIPLPDSYLLFQIPLFGGNFFFGSFLLQSKRLGLWLAITIGLILFFKLGRFAFTGGVIIFISVTSALLLFALHLKKLGIIKGHG